MTCRSRRVAALERGSAYCLHIRLKTKHSRVHTFQVGGWRPSTSSRPGGLILVEDDDPVAVATLALADKDRQDLVDLLHKYGRQHPPPLFREFIRVAASGGRSHRWPGALSVLKLFRSGSRRGGTGPPRRTRNRTSETHVLDSRTDVMKKRCAAFA